MKEDVKFIQNLVKCLSGLDISWIDGTEKEIIRLAENILDSRMRSMINEQAVIKFFRNMRPNCIYEGKAPLHICYLAIRSVEDQYLLIGPCVTEPVTEIEAQMQLRHYGVEPEMAQLLVEYSRTLPEISCETFHQLGVLLANHLYELPMPIPYQQLDYLWSNEFQKRIMLVDHYEDMSQMRQVELRYEISTTLTEAVKQGNLSLAYQAVRQMNAMDMNIIGNPNPMRNAQNMCISLNTQLRYAMEEAGVHPYQLDRFSNEIALQIEKLSSTAEANKFAMEIIRRYCNLARESTYPELKPFTHLAVTYIKEHLSDNLTVKGAAQALMVNANYLSYEFHRDMGITFIDFVNQERIRQAAALLKHTNLQIQQIAATVGYNNTSYFSKQFVKYQNMTPRAYRNGGML